MTNGELDSVSGNYSNTTDVVKGHDIFYRCLECQIVISSTSIDNIGCACGNVFIDKDSWRLIVANFNKLEVLRRGN